MAVSIVDLCCYKDLVLGVFIPAPA
jgi:hypothetical protein